MADRAYFTKKAKYLAKKLEDKNKPYVPPAPPPFRPITGHRVMKMRWRIRRIRKKKPLRTYRKRTDRVEYIIFRTTRFEKMQWYSIADDLDMPLGAMLRMAMRYFLSSSRYIRSLIDGDEEILTIKRAKRSTIEKRIMKSFGIDAPDPIAEAIRAAYAKRERMKEFLEKRKSHADPTPKKKNPSAGPQRSDVAVPGRPIERNQGNRPDVSSGYSTSRAGGTRPKTQILEDPKAADGSSAVPVRPSPPRPRLMLKTGD